MVSVWVTVTNEKNQTLKAGNETDGSIVLIAVQENPNPVVGTIEMKFIIPKDQVARFLELIS